MTHAPAAAPAETCVTCGFDAAEWNAEDTVNTLRSLAARWRGAAEGVSDEALGQRPSDGVWSAAEYAAHVAEAPPRTGFHASVDLLEEALLRLHAGGRPTAAVDSVRAVVHHVSHHLTDTARGLVALGHGAAADTGVVVGLHRSAGGVPKRPVPQVTIGRRGLDGDRQATRKHHGRPWQALCLWSIEVIDRLREEGHPIGPGCAGENITIQGIDWAALRVGTRLRIGPVLAEVSAHSTPCVKNARWFEGGDFHRIDHNAHPGWSRLYASVIDTGTVSDGDDVVVEP